MLPQELQTVTELPISVVLSLITISSSTNTKCLSALPCTYSRSQRQNPSVNNKTIYRNPMSNPVHLFASHLRKGILNIQEGPIWHDEKRLNEMYTLFEMLSQVRELKCNTKILVPTVSWHCLVVSDWLLTASLVILGFFKNLLSFWFSVLSSLLHLTCTK